MTKWIWLWLLAAAVFVAAADDGNQTRPMPGQIGLLISSYLDADYQAYLETHNKILSPYKRIESYQHFHGTKQLVADHNHLYSLGRRSYKLALNHFADQKNQDRDLYNGAIPPKKREGIFDNGTDESYSRQAAPALVDYRSSNCMPAIKNQGACGDCWAFAANTPVEYQNCYKFGKATPTLLSEQQHADCSTAYGNKGCTGGFYTNAWNYATATKGQMSSASYPYKAMIGPCRFSASHVVSTFSSWVWVPANNETAILKAVAAKGPISCVVYANANFQLYAGGIFNDPKCPADGVQVNHAVVVVGYGTANKTDYWIIRNSWGTTWGEKGYMRLIRGVNMCNIASYPAYASV